MRHGKHSRTAESAAAFRAAHFIYDKDHIFEDPFAIEMVGSTLRIILSNRVLFSVFFTKLLRSVYRPAQAQILSRCRYAEDCLEEAIKEGIDQYIIIGAGLDTFCLRRADLLDSLHVYEIDHPATQQYKRSKLKRMGENDVHNVRYVSVDHENEAFATALQRSGFDQHRPAFISWLGTTPYLTQSAIMQTLQAISSSCAPGSIIVFDYGVSSKLITPEDAQILKKVQRLTALMGEPLRFEIIPEDFINELRKLGFECLDDLAVGDYIQRYFAERNDDLKPIDGSRYCRLRIASPPDSSE